MGTGGGDSGGRPFISTVMDTDIMLFWFTGDFIIQVKSIFHYISSPYSKCMSNSPIKFNTFMFYKTLTS